MSLRNTLAWFALTVCVAQHNLAVGEEIRTWTDSTGNFKVKASFERLEDAFIFLKRESNESTFRVPLVHLSDSDLEWLKKNKKELLPAAKEVEPLRLPFTEDTTTTVLPVKADDGLTLRFTAIYGAGNVSFSNQQLDVGEEVSAELTDYTGIRIDFRLAKSDDKLLFAAKPRTSLDDKFEIAFSKKSVNRTLRAVTESFEKGKASYQAAEQAIKTIPREVVRLKSMLSNNATDGLRNGVIASRIQKLESAYRSARGKLKTLSRSLPKLQSRLERLRQVAELGDALRDEVTIHFEVEQRLPKGLSYIAITTSQATSPAGEDIAARNPGKGLVEVGKGVAMPNLIGSLLPQFEKYCEEIEGDTTLQQMLAYETLIQNLESQFAGKRLAVNFIITDVTKSMMNDTRNMGEYDLLLQLDSTEQNADESKLREVGGGGFSTTNSQISIRYPPRIRRRLDLNTAAKLSRGTRLQISGIPEFGKDSGKGITLTRGADNLAVELQKIDIKFIFED